MMAEGGNFLNIMLESWLPFIVLIVVYVFFMKQVRGAKSPMAEQAGELKEINATLKEISKKLDK